MPPHRPLILAHRGASALLPENTLPAFARALELGADGVELDVHETDAGFVVHHDPDAPEGLVAGRPAKHGGVIPSLGEVLDLLAAGRPGATVFLEVKGMRSWTALRYELAPYRGRLDLEVQSFAHEVLAAAAAEADGWPLGLIARSPGPDPVDLLDRFGARTLSLLHAAADAGLAAALRQAGRRLAVWTVNDTAGATALAALPVDALVTDDPAALLAGLS